MKEPTIELHNNAQFRVRFNETDPLGIVWHGHYITYFEDGRESFGEQYSISYRNIEDEGFLAPIVKCTCDYKKPLRFGDRAKIETTYVHQPATKLVFRYKILNMQGQVVATGETIQVFTDKSGELQLSDPPFFRDWKTKWGLI